MYIILPSASLGSTTRAGGGPIQKYDSRVTYKGILKCTGTGDHACHASLNAVIIIFIYIYSNQLKTREVLYYIYLYK